MKKRRVAISPGFKIFEYYKKNRQALDALRAPLFEDKVIDFILELADVKEKTVSMEELTAEEDESYTSTKKSAKKPAKTKAAKSDSKPKETAKKKPAAKKTAKK